MTDELEIEEVVEDSPTLPETPPESWRETIKSWFPGLSKPPNEEVEKSDPKALAQAVKILQSGGYKISAQKLAGMMRPGYGGGGSPDEEEDDEMEMGRKTRKEETPVNKQQTLPEPVITDIVKAELEVVKSEYAGILEEVQKSNKALQEENAALRKDLEGIRSDRDVEKQARRKTQAIRKAESLLRLPVASTDLAELLIKAEDGLGEDYEKFEALLKATDRQLFTAGLFGEIGTSRTPEQVTIEDKLEKMAKEQDISPEEALLQLSAEDQAMLRKSWDEQQGGR